ncbi:hypothetical protein BC102111_02349 [Brevibacterium casei CIP 102111]|uniref:XcbB/CpsF family capsular polysaccharide biosynthesis protein n=1 Tax=Brevibacterium casei CIP 102111 TaxID=1255625 RepID=A0A2H1JK79_9MICO|nr:hypothetical protein BC102111_02349 [Brevibacterium casei CIP 102111]
MRGNALLQLVGPGAVRCSLSSQVDELLSSLKDLHDDVLLVEVEHRNFALDDSNLIRIGSRIREFRPIVEWFARNGWFLYKSDGSTSSLVRHDHISKLWHKITDGSYNVDRRGTVYSINDDNAIERASSLIVVFSSMSLPFDGPGLSRFFEQNFSSIGKHVGQGVVVLRIADIDGVVGGFYSPTVFAPDRIDRVQSLIGEIASLYAIDPERVILYGGSKGGSGALLHALVNGDGWKCVAVDPVVDDYYYESKYLDSHWTSGTVFIERKEELFSRVVDSVSSHGNTARIGIVTSPRSPLYSTIETLASKVPHSALLFAESHDPLINDHPDVSGRTLRFVTGLLNVWSAGLQFPGSRLRID